MCIDHLVITVESYFLNNDECMMYDPSKSLCTCIFFLFVQQQLSLIPLSGVGYIDQMTL